MAGLTDRIRTGVLGATAALLLIAAPALLGAEPAPAAAPPSARDFARAPALEGVKLSPDGKHIVALTSQDGDTVQISVWDADHPEHAPAVIGAAPRLKFLGVGFLKNDRLLVVAIQQITVGNIRGHLTKQWITDLTGSFWRPLMPESHGASEEAAFTERFADAEVIDPLPLDPDNVIIEDHRTGHEGDVYRLNVRSGGIARMEKGSEKFDSPITDLKGEIRAKTELGFDNGRLYLAQWIKNPDTGKWEEHFRSYAKDRVITTIVGFTKDPNIVMVSTPNGGDRAGVFEYDIRQRKILEPVFEHRLFEGAGVITSKAAADFGEPLGFVYGAERGRVYWSDPKLASQAKAVETALGITRPAMDWVDVATNAHVRAPISQGDEALFVSMSADRSRIIVEKSGPRTPGDFYLLNADGSMRLLGRARPWIDNTALGETRLVQYPARDGLMIPAFLTTPNKAIFGEGPYPTLIEPHGGPWSRDEMGWDVTGWTQYFASRGYAVLQPQFRGSEGWGQKLWRAGDGQWGGTMQDDKDDGAKWLIAQKIAAPDRIAMFGYSYGGYAALAAAIRPNGLYQCAISGAGAGDLASLRRATHDNRFQREFQNPTIKGLDALEHAAEAQIPVFLYHGDRDRTVDIAQSNKFAAALKAAHKPYRMLTIPDMGHQYVTWTPAMGELQLVEVEKYLKTECGPGGL